MNAKDYLLEYKRIAVRIDILRSEIEQLRTEAESATINLDGMPKGTGAHDKTARLAVQLAAYETDLAEELSHLYSKRIEIINKLGELSDGKHQKLLHARYIDGKTWECIAYEMDITWRYCYMLHGEALQELDKLLKK